MVTWAMIGAFAVLVFLSIAGSLNGHSGKRLF